MKTEKIQFDLERYNNGEYISLETRCGYPVRIICTTKKDEEQRPIVALEESLKGLEEVFCVTKTGRVYDNVLIDSDDDIFMVVNKSEPKNGEEYWYIVSDGKIIQTAFDIKCQTAMDRFEFGNFFRTEEEAKKCLEKIKKVFEE